MIAFTAIRTTLETAIEANATLTGYSCIVDDGWQNDEIEAALRDAGIVIVISPFIHLIPRQQECGSINIECNFVVSISINPSVNADLTTPLVMETMLSALITAIIGIAPEADNDRYRIADEGIRLIVSDEQGPHKYIVPVVKRALIS